jgi:hypothetical protein
MESPEHGLRQRLTEARETLKVIVFERERAYQEGRLQEYALFAGELRRAREQLAQLEAEVLRLRETGPH